MQFFGSISFQTGILLCIQLKNIMLKAMQKQFCGKMAELKGRITKACCITISMTAQYQEAHYLKE